MKNIYKVLRIIALVVVIGFSMITCGGGGKTVNSAAELKEYLDKQPANGPDKPIKVNMTVNDMTLKEIPRILTSAGKFVNLDLSRSTGLTIIEKETFAGSYSRENNVLTGIILPNNVTGIEDKAFAYCSNLVSVTIPKSVTSIKSDAFDGCTSLTAINVSSGNTTYSSEKSILFNKDKTTLVLYFGGEIDTFTIPNNVTSIGDRAFYGKQLSSVIIPNGVSSIGSRAFGYNQLTSVTIPNSVTSMQGDEFDMNQLESITIGANVSIPDGAFWESRDGSGHSNAFGQSYNNGGKQAGTYNRSTSRTSDRFSPDGYRYSYTWTKQ